MKLLLLPVTILLIGSCTNKKKTETGTENSSADTAIVTPDKNPPAPEVNISIIGKWRPFEINLKDMEEKEKEDILENASIEFTADGKYISLFKEDNETGTYSYSEKEKILTTNSPKGKIEKLSVEWDNDKLKLTNEEGTLIFIRSSK